MAKKGYNPEWRIEHFENIIRGLRYRVEDLKRDKAKLHAEYGETIRKIVNHDHIESPIDTGYRTIDSNILKCVLVEYDCIIDYVDDEFLKFNVKEDFSSQTVAITGLLRLMGYTALCMFADANSKNPRIYYDAQKMTKKAKDAEVIKWED